MRVLRAADYRRMPWKNGGGETFEIAVLPAGAPLDSMDWRISMAVVGSDGPFSSFPGVDRTLSILAGDGIGLTLNGTDEYTLSVRSLPFHFPADVPATARLLGSAVTDLNVMTRRQGYRHAVDRLAFSDRRSVALQADEAAVFCSAGSITCSVAGEQSVLLQERDCALFGATPRRLELAASGPATVLLVAFYRTTA